MRRRAAYFLLCVCFCFSSLSLSSSAASQDLIEEGYIYDPGTGSYYLPDDFSGEISYEEETTLYAGDPELLEEGFSYDPYLGIYYIGEDFPMMDLPSSFLAASPNFPDFNPNLVPWEAAPDYIKEILYNTPFIATNSSSYPSGVPWKQPFVLVMTNGSVVRVVVGINLIFGSYFATQDSLISHSPTGTYIFCEVLDASASILPGVEYSCAYEARFDINTLDVLVDWHSLSPVATGNRFSRFTGSLTGLDLGWDYYLYGGNGIPPGRTGYTVPINVNQTSTYPAVVCVNDPELGFAGTSNFLRFYEDYPYSYFSSFVPATYEEKQLETEKGILSGIKGMWESIKALPETIGEKIKSLFVPSDGYFEDYTNSFQAYFKDCFGIIYELPDTVISIIRDLSEFSPSEDGYFIHFPEVSMPVLDNGIWYDRVIIEETDITFDFLEQGAFKSLYTMYRSVVWLIFVFALINLLIRKANNIFGG